MPSACIGTESDDEDMEASLARFAAQSQATAPTIAAAGFATTLTTSTAVVVGGNSDLAETGDDNGNDVDDEEEEDDSSDEGNDEGELAAVAAPPPPTLKVVFLDIDGVLNTRPDPRFLHVEGGPCALLRRLLESSKAKIVLTTPWRRHSRYITEVLTKFDVFSEDDVPEDLERTPVNADATRRDLEILQWLRARRGTVKAWVALDAADLLRFPSAMHLEGHVVRTSESALGPNELERCLEILGVREEATTAAAAAAAASAVAATAGPGSVGEGAQGPSPVGATPASAAFAAPANWAQPPQMKITLAHTPPPWDVKSALRWDDALAGKMEDLLHALVPNSSYRMPGTPILLPPSSSIPKTATTAADSTKITCHKDGGVETVEVTFDEGMGGGVFRTKAAGPGDNASPVLSLAEQRRRAEQQKQQQQQQQEKQSVSNSAAPSLSDAFRKATTWDDELVKGMEDLLKLLPSTSTNANDPKSGTKAAGTTFSSSGTQKIQEPPSPSATQKPQQPPLPGIGGGSEFDTFAELARSKFAPASR
mmetsp:Transcript_90324/g.188889  ORF Transcript_90324/g.188889 Transcript_90324/m.188889 type:complete len:537 (+) Transcript_90324:21-1631(+)